MRWFVYGLKTSIVRSPLRSPPTFSPAMRICSCRNVAPPPARPTSGRASVGSLFDMIEGQVESVEIAEAPIEVDAPKLAVDDQRHALFRNAAVRAQGRVEAAQVVPRRRRADHLRALGDDDEIAD